MKRQSLRSPPSAAQMLEVVLNQHRTLLRNVEDETNNCPIIEAETEAIELLKKQHLDLNTGISLAMDFADLVRRKQPDKLAEWLKNAEESKIRAITGFATKLKDDLDAVENGVTYQWSNGQVEGQVNRLKMLKRQMYGRASHELLKKRFLCPV